MHHFRICKLVTVKFAILKTRGHSIVACGITRCFEQVCNVTPVKIRVASHTVIEYACIGLATAVGWYLKNAHDCPYDDKVYLFK